MATFLGFALPILQQFLPIIIQALIKMFWVPDVEVAGTLAANPNAPNFNIYAKP